METNNNKMESMVNIEDHNKGTKIQDIFECDTEMEEKTTGMWTKWSL